LLRPLLALAGATFTLATAYSTGRLILRRPGEPWWARLAVGGLVLSLLVFALLAIGWGTDRAFLAAGAVLSLPLLLAARPGNGNGGSQASASLTRCARIAWLAMGVYATMYLVHALAPEIQPDAYTYHLGLVREWLREGKLVDRAGFYEALPHGAEMLYSFTYAFGRHSAARLVHLAFWVAAVPVLASLARRLAVPEDRAWIAAALVFLSPVAGISASSAYNDAMLVFFALAALARLPAPGGAQWRLDTLVAGMLAGFCYAIKMTGGVVIVACALLLVHERRFRSLPWLVAGAAIPVLPWMVRNWWWFHNPLAPFANRWFENPYFHAASEAELLAALRSYPGVNWRNWFWELVARGEKLQGLLGPAFLLLPAAGLGSRSRVGRRLLGLGLLLATPWLLNMGARFLLLALPLLTLALVTSLPRKLAVGLLVVQFVLCLPWTMDLYAHPHAWRLRGLPWRAAIGIEDEAEYLRRVLPEYRTAEMVNRHAGPGQRVFDFTGLPRAYVDATVISCWGSAQADRLRHALQLAADKRPLLVDWVAEWPAQPLRSLRVEIKAAGSEPWSIHELELEGPAGPLKPAPEWRLRASPNPWEAPLALDRNLISRWSTWEPARRGTFFEVRFPAPQLVSSVRLVTTSDVPMGGWTVLGQATQPGWIALSENFARMPRPWLDLRRSASRLLREAGISHLLIRVSDDPVGQIGWDLERQGVAWGIERVDCENSTCLFRVF